MSGIREGLLMLDKFIINLMKWILFLLLGAMTLIVLLGVIFRYLLMAPLPWAEELARYLMVWGASLGAAVAFREGSHIAVTMVMDRLQGLARKIIVRCGQIIIFIFMAIVVIEGFILAIKVSAQESPAMEISMTWPYLAIPIGCLLILFEIPLMIFFHNPFQREGKEES